MFPIIRNTYLIMMTYPIHNSPVGISIALTIRSLDPSLGLWRERDSALLYTYRPAGAFKDRKNLHRSSERMVSVQLSG